MDAWLNEVYGLFLSIFSRETQEETYIVIGLCILFGALALSRVGTALGSLGAFFTTGVLLTAGGLALLIGMLALPPVFGFDVWWMPLVAAVATLLVVVLPLTMLFHRGGYIAALIAWTIALLTVGAILATEPIAMRAFEKVLKESQRLGQHRVEVESFK